ncbi:adipocyte plasma membrane-associated protein Hemomucin-like [Plodia interpunctella]|uniref:adipocyte plasma membrane-associated protein Hemomucin-like n=1 Tax=Plodia interpunctella TaxID=58824 RepID=UPI002368B1A3|nr:adipocyte plasma membrane-associated protein Hemomucin-like [Plodia interpunctella]
MGFVFGIVKWIIKCFLLFIIFAAIIVLIPNLPPYTKFTSITLDPGLPLVGPLAWNNALDNPDLLYKGKVLGPEAFKVHNGEVYTSLATGEIVKFTPGGHIIFVTKIGEPCAGLIEEHKCGRPLGFAIDAKTNELYVCDAYHGIWKVDLKNDKKQLLVSPRKPVGGKRPMLINSIALAENGDFYWTDSTSDFHLKDGAYALLTDPSGRLFYYNAAKNESKVLLDKLWFANGVAISPDKQFVVVSETSRFRLVKLYISGPKKGKSEVFISGLPGTPDNVQVLPDGSGLLVSLYSTYDEEHPILSRTMTQVPLLRKFLVRLQHLIELSFEFLNKHFPNVIFAEIVHHCGHFKSIGPFVWDRAGIVQVDWNGNVVAAYYSENPNIPHMSDAIVFNDKLYIGAPHEQDFIAAVPAPPALLKAYATAGKVPKPAQQFKAEPVRAEPKPKVEENKVPPKQEKEQPKAKPTEATKATTTTTPKPTSTPKPTEAPTTAKPVTTAPSAAKVTPPPARDQNKSKPSTPKTEAPAQNLKQETKKPETVTQKPPKASDSGKPAKQIPIKEEIPSDIAKPSKETLKVITKGGPTEIPNPGV